MKPHYKFQRRRRDRKKALPARRRAAFMNKSMGEARKLMKGQKATARRNKVPAVKSARARYGGERSVRRSGRRGGSAYTSHAHNSRLQMRRRRLEWRFCTRIRRVDLLCPALAANK
ncbi:hypothetical protein EVAR_8371_1 [Eumeta japonica]|uniref:Uncharacterized protein n=1 Tax=Eumeta variegata TaxID=151549 RepID=A0A4C1VCM9_EUMVA|nr:hypothetical protein EVAR_8371_1 [Eumeta japonica]